MVFIWNFSYEKHLANKDLFATFWIPWLPGNLGVLSKKIIGNLPDSIFPKIIKAWFTLVAGCSNCLQRAESLWIIGNFSIFTAMDCNSWRSHQLDAVWVRFNCMTSPEDLPMMSPECCWCYCRYDLGIYFSRFMTLVDDLNGLPSHSPPKLKIEKGIFNKRTKKLITIKNSFKASSHFVIFYHSFLPFHFKIKF